MTHLSFITWLTANNFLWGFISVVWDPTLNHEWWRIFLFFFLSVLSIFLHINEYNHEISWTDWKNWKHLNLHNICDGIYWLEHFVLAKKMRNDSKAIRKNKIGNLYGIEIIIYRSMGMAIFTPKREYDE